MPAFVDSEHVPRWVAALDALTCVIGLLAIYALATGTGVHGQVAGLRISLTSPLRLSVAAGFLAGLRHALFRRPSLGDRLRPCWAAAAEADWPKGPAADRARPARAALAWERTGWLWPVLVAGLFCAPLFVGLGRTDLENDEAGYWSSVETILRTGDWLTPKMSPSLDAPLDKPPLKIWLVAAPIRLGLLPDNEFGLRFWDAVFGTVAFLYVFAIGRMIGGPLCGFIAALTLFLYQPLVFDHGLRTNNMEAALVLCYCGGVYHFLAWTKADAGRPRHIYAVALYFVLGFMTKFVAALFLPLVLAATLFLRGDRGRLWRDRGALFGAGALAFALITPWFVYESYHLGAGFWHMMLGQTVVTRFTAHLDPAHVRPWSFYLAEILNHLSDSQTAQLVRAGLALLLFRAIRGRSDATVIVLWFALPIALMSLGTSKLHHYVYPFLPPLALAAGYVCAVGFDIGWSLMSRRWPAIRRIVATSSLRAVTPRLLRAALLGVGIAAMTVATATYAFGTVHLTIGPLVVLDNWTVVRPTMIAILLFTLAGCVTASMRTATVLVLLFMLPSSLIYRQELKRLAVDRHQLRTARDCLQPICARFATGDARGPGVWVDHEALTHPLYYYLRDLGPWQKQDSASDAMVYVHLYSAPSPGPVLLSNVRFGQFVAGARAGDHGRIEDEARNANTHSGLPGVATSHDPVGVLRLDNGVLLLPGPYRSCAAEQYTGTFRSAPVAHAGR